MDHSRGRLATLPGRAIRWPLMWLWRGWGSAGMWLRRGITAAFRAVWHFLGRLGLALRHLLSILLWRPVRFFLTPWWLAYKRILHPPLSKMFQVFGRPLARLLRLLFAPAIRRWHTSGAGRRRRQRALRSRWTIARARLRVALRQPRPPSHAVVVPTVPPPNLPRERRRVARLATTGIALGLVVFAGLVTAQQTPQLSGATGQNGYQLSSSKFGTRPAVEPATATAVPPTATATPYASPTPWPTPDPLNGGGSVAFTLRQNGHSDIYALSIGQSQPIRLTNDLADDRDPAWSPDGSKLAFASHRDGNWEIYVLYLPDGSLRRITFDPAFDAGPSWSPDGEWLVFESYRNNNLDLYIVSTEGEEAPLRLTRNESPDFSPAWSPAGRHIAFTSWRGGNKDIFLLSLDEAADEAARNLTATPGQHEDHAAFSPDGTRLAFSEDGSGLELIYTLQLDGGTPAGTVTAHGQGRHPTWSPDGKAVSYIHSRGAQNHLIAGSLDAWSVAPQAFTTDNLLDSPDWSARTLPLQLPEHLAQMNEVADEPFFVEVVYPPQEDGPPQMLLEVPVNAPSPYLNDRVDHAFLALRERVQEKSGWDFLGEVDNLYSPIAAKPLPGQTDRTWNKAGRAFDYVAEYALEFDPRVEVVREETPSGTYWRTYLKAESQDGSQGEPLRDLPWDFRARYGAEPRYYDEGGKYRSIIPSGYYVDFTTLASDFGWERTATSENWRTFFPGIGYWHYEKRQGLNWEQAMLEIYTADEILSVFR